MEVDLAPKTVPLASPENGEDELQSSQALQTVLHASPENGEDESQSSRAPQTVARASPNDDENRTLSSLLSPEVLKDVLASFRLRKRNADDEPRQDVKDKEESESSGVSQGELQSNRALQTASNAPPEDEQDELQSSGPTQIASLAPSYHDENGQSSQTEADEEMQGVNDNAVNDDTVPECRVSHHRNDADSSSVLEVSQASSESCEEPFCNCEKSRYKWDADSFNAFRTCLDLPSDSDYEDCENFSSTDDEGEEGDDEGEDEKEQEEENKEDLLKAVVLYRPPQSPPPSRRDFMFEGIAPLCLTSLSPSSSNPSNAIPLHAAPTSGALTSIEMGEEDEGDELSKSVVVYRFSGQSQAPSRRDFMFEGLTLSCFSSEHRDPTFQASPLETPIPRPPPPSEPIRPRPWQRKRKLSEESPSKDKIASSSNDQRALSSIDDRGSPSNDKRARNSAGKGARNTSVPPFSCIFTNRKDFLFEGRLSFCSPLKIPPATPIPSVIPLKDRVQNPIPLRWYEQPTAEARTLCLMMRVKEFHAGRKRKRDSESESETRKIRTDPDGLSVQSDVAVQNDLAVQYDEVVPSDLVDRNDQGATEQVDTTRNAGCRVDLLCEGVLSTCVSCKDMKSLSMHVLKSQVDPPAIPLPWRPTVVQLGEDSELVASSTDRKYDEDAVGGPTQEGSDSSSAESERSLTEGMTKELATTDTIRRRMEIEAASFTSSFGMTVKAELVSNSSTTSRKRKIEFDKDDNCAEEGSKDTKRLVFSESEYTLEANRFDVSKIKEEYEEDGTKDIHGFTEEMSTSHYGPDETFFSCQATSEVGQKDFAEEEEEIEGEYDDEETLVKPAIEEEEEEEEEEEYDNEETLVKPATEDENSRDSCQMDVAERFAAFKVQKEMEMTQKVLSRQSSTQSLPQEDPGLNSTEIRNQVVESSLIQLEILKGALSRANVGDPSNNWIKGRSPAQADGGFQDLFKDIIINIF